MSERSLNCSQVPPLSHISTQVTPVHIVLSGIFKVHTNNVFQSKPPQTGLFHSRFETKITYGFGTSLTRATFPTNLFLLDFMTLIIFGQSPRYTAFFIEVCTVLGYYADYTGNYLPKFPDNLLAPHSRIKKFSWIF